MKNSIAMVLMTIAAGGLALAQPKTDPKAGSAAPKAPDTAKKAPDAPKTPDKAPPADAKMPEMKPPAEVAGMAAGMAGNWKCTGKGAMDPNKPEAMTDMKGTFKASLDLDKYWIKGEWTGTMGAGKTAMKAKGYMYTTYDAAGKKWMRMSMDNMGMGGVETSAGLPAGAKEGKVTWEGETHMMGMTMKTRTTEEVAAKSVKMIGEMSMDGGKQYKQTFEMTCTK